MQPADAYVELIRKSREASVLSSAASLLSWDQETYMPAGGAEHRGNQLALLAGLVHDRRTDPRIGELLEAVEGSPLLADPASPAAVNARELRRGYDRATKLPKSLVEELARTTSLAQQTWAEARKASDFRRFEPWLEKIIGLKRQEAAALGGDDPYDALLDEFEPGTTCREIEPLLAGVRADLVPLINAIAASGRKPDESILRRDFPVDLQKSFGSAAAAELGFDFEKGRIDLAPHPFCMGVGPGDCRLTTRFNANYFNDGFFSILHEAGHGMYEQGLDPEHYGEPMGDAASLGIHETQSRLWENYVGRSSAFWRRCYPKAQGTFASLKDVSFDSFYAAVNRVAPSFIRVDADEVTYNLHIIVRFEIERLLLSGNLQASAVPEAWNDRMKTYLGVTPPDDRRGCLQDVHWSCGLVGYFPTYTLGNIGAAQLFAKADADLGGVDAMLERGEYRPLLEWMRERIHRHGMRYRPADLLRHATGEAPSPKHLAASLRKKYGELYGF